MKLKAEIYLDMMPNCSAIRFSDFIWTDLKVHVHSLYISGRKRGEKETEAEIETAMARNARNIEIRTRTRKSKRRRS